MTQEYLSALRAREERPAYTVEEIVGRLFLEPSLGSPS